MAQKSTLLNQLEDEGYIVVKELLKVENDLQPVMEEYSLLLNKLSQSLYASGSISNTYENLPFDKRLTALLIETNGAIYQNLEISLPQNGIDFGTPIHHGPAVFQLLRNPKLLDVIEKLIGPEIYSNPVQHVRIKPPQNLLSTDQQENSLISQAIWHQDQGTVREEADETTILTVWIPVVDATEENGCLVVVPGSHRQGLSLHCEMPAGTHEIPERFIESNRKTLPMKAGDVLFMTKATMHSSLPNISDGIRWSFDLRYNPIGEATGRPWFPGFVARSRAYPSSELQDPEIWAKSWREARANLAKQETPVFQRWDHNDPLCA